MLATDHEGLISCTAGIPVSLTTIDMQRCLFTGPRTRPNPQTISAPAPSAQLLCDDPVRCQYLAYGIELFISGDSLARAATTNVY